jgi:hypothetical protein
MSLFKRNKLNYAPMDMTTPALKEKGNSFAGREFSQMKDDASYREAYKRWHWGAEPTQVLEWESDAVDSRGRQLYPDTLLECGRLIELRFRIPNTRRDLAMTLPEEQAQRSYLTFDPDHPHERLYVLLPEDVRTGAKDAYWRQNPYQAFDMNALAKHVGGRHGKSADYPTLAVKPVGILTAFSYACLKENDGYCVYVHRAGEETGTRPCLCADSEGRLWIVGGNYRSPTAGVTD